MKDNKIIFGTLIVLLLLLTVGLSYAYFSTSVKGNDNAKNVVVEAGTLKLTYTDGPAINAQYIKPGWTTTKTVSVKNNGTLDTNYDIIWQSLTNTITNNELVLSATCQRLNASGVAEGTCVSISQAPISDTTIAKKIAIESGITHKYTFTILFKETNADQNYNQGKKFSGVLGIEETSRFTLDDWNTIVENVKSGNTSMYKVGDTKEVNLGSTYGTHTLRVANTSIPSECSTSGFSQTACGFVLEFADIITTHNMNPIKRPIDDYGHSEGGWPASSMYTFVNEDIYNLLPSELKGAIIDTVTISGYGERDTTNFTSTDKLYLLSTAEVWAQGSSHTIEYDTARDVTRQLDYYKNLRVTTDNYSGAIKKTGTSATMWWLRSAASNSNDIFYRVNDNGYRDYGLPNVTHGVAPAFRLG